MIRGDTANFKFTVNMQNIKGKSEPWIPTENDRVYFTCKKDFDSEVAFQKVYPETISYDTETNYFHTTVEPKDTCRLKAGDYLYEIKIVKNAINADEVNKKIVKTISQGHLEIQREVATRKDGV